MRIAIVQDGPEYFNLEATVEKTISLMKAASEEGADLVIFGECWLSGYPIWLDVCEDINLWESPPVQAVWARMYANSPEVAGPEIDQICQSARSLKIYVVMGLNETVSSGKGQGTIYNSVITIDTSGTIVNHHRKLMPTYTERLVYGQGDAGGLQSVKTPFGRLGALICWEHWMPLTRQAMHDAGEHIHVALWPMVKEMNHVACRQYAFEGRCLVVAAGQIMHMDELPPELTLSKHIQIPENQLLMRGGSAIYGANGDFIVPQVYDTRQLIYAEVDTAGVIATRMNLDVSGHYQRPDIFELKINRVDRSS